MLPFTAVTATFSSCTPSETVIVAFSVCGIIERFSFTVTSDEPCAGTLPEVVETERHSSDTFVMLQLSSALPVLPMFSTSSASFFGEMESVAFALTAFRVTGSSFVPSETMKEVFKSPVILLLSSFTCTTFLPAGATVPSLSETVMQSEVIPLIFQSRLTSPVFFISNVCSCAVSPKSSVVGDTLISVFFSPLGEQETEMGNELPKAERFTTTDFVSPNSVSVFPLLVTVTDISSWVVPKFREEGVIVISASFFSGVRCMSPEVACPANTFTDLVFVVYPAFCACT